MITCNLLVVVGLGVRAAALLHLLPPLPHCSIKITEITWKTLCRRTDITSLFLIDRLKSSFYILLHVC